MTYTLVPSGLIATPIGSFPTGTVFARVLFPVLNTETVLLLRPVIYAYEGVGEPFNTTFTVEICESVPFELLTVSLTV